MATVVPGAYSLLPEAASFLSSPKRLLIGGDWVEPADGRSFESIDPATGETIGDAPEAGEEDVDRAVAAARKALEGPWGRMTAPERERLLLRFADVVEAHGSELAQLDSLDSGKPWRQIEAVDVPLAVGQLRYFAGWPSKLEGSTIPSAYPGVHVYTRREPLGVVGAIVPWNFPLCQACFKLAPALAAGCAVVLKPAEQTPFSALRLGALALEAGLPEGVLNVLPGFGERTGRALVTHPGVDKIAFTGSEQVGKEIAASGAATLKHVSLELGGKNPNIVFADADLEKAAVTAAAAIFFYTGQVCSAGSRLMVERPVYEDVVARIVDEAGKLQLGPGLHDDTTLGPLVSEEQRARVTGFVEQAADSGAQVVVGGKWPAGDLARGYFHEPTVLADVPDEHTVVRDEIFGPVLVAQPFESVEEVARRANDNRMGLAAGVWTTDVRKAHAVAAALESGTVWVNTYNLFDAATPWGGYKQSGYGRDSGREGVEKYLQTKSIFVDYND